jgi:hypothetical protein
MNPEVIGRVLDALGGTAESVSGDCGYALPDGTLRLLREIVEAAGVRRVFEFGSGRSTKAFLAAGCEVTALEDSEEWLEQTLATLTPEERTRLHAIRQPLAALFFQGAPFRSWVLDADALRRLAEAELVLIDAPAFPPFREHALSLSLERCGGVIVVDDAGIPTVGRFCKRMGVGMWMRECGVDHGLCFFMSEGGGGAGRRGIVETAKAWRRFYLAGKMGGV